MANDAGSASPVGAEPWPPGLVDLDKLDRHAADVFDYCRALVGNEDVAASATEAAVSHVQSLRDARKLRAWLFSLARREALAPGGAGDDEAGYPYMPRFIADDLDATYPGQSVGARPLLDPSREILALVYRHGLHPGDLHSVLGVTADEAQEKLAVAEAEFGAAGLASPTAVKPVPPALVNLDSFREPFRRHAAHVFDYCHALVGREEVAASATEAALSSVQPLVNDPGRFRAWLFALAREEALAFQAAGAGEPGLNSVPRFEVDEFDATIADLSGGATLLDDQSQEIIDLVHRYGIDPEDLPLVI